jgi:hypothetical protein
LIDSSARDGLAVKTSRHVPKGIEDIPNWLDDDDDDDDESDELFFAETKPTPPFKVSSMLVTFARRQKRQIALRDEEERKRDGVPSLVLFFFRRRSRCRFFSIIITLSVCDSFFLSCVSSLPESPPEKREKTQQKCKQNFYENPKRFYPLLYPIKKIAKYQLIITCFAARYAREKRDRGARARSEKEIHPYTVIVYLF